ncbi:hypothetical protein [Taibaiella chishuiensis]|uniref:Outer membrane protein with beta-barrel domain n=1 Tax=Taibaiella chishuiensis TaxID=1434707 RepID=A0A2P8DAW7_9BACT|nr:hypothetical protein [Taibaiella chishuiensis]PSK94366.1 hypothetical protein B0I18_101521 [Taibaiella chishuiensis]
MKTYPLTILSGVLISLSTLYTSPGNAQSSLACYSSQPKNLTWAIGIRTGIAAEYDRSYSTNNESRRLDQSQQVFLQSYLSKHFVLELHSLRQTSTKDNRSFISQPGRHYSLATRKSQHLHNNISLNYLLPAFNERVQFGMGLGAGFLASFDQVREIYTTTASTEPIENHSNAFHADAPNLIFNISSNFKINRNLFASAQALYSNNPTTELEHITFNIGVGYYFY